MFVSAIATPANAVGWVQVELAVVNYFTELDKI